jgi:hypothetical protein
MEPLAFPFKILLFGAFAVFKPAGNIFCQHFRSVRELLGTNIVIFRNLVYCFLLFHGLKGYPRLEGASCLLRLAFISVVS